MVMTRWDPWRELEDFRRSFSRLVGRSPFDGSAYTEELGPHPMDVDVIEGKDRFTVRAAVAGMRPEDVDINIENDVLTIRGQRTQQALGEGETYLRGELRWGTFERALRLPPTVDAEHADANFEHGLLTISLPKKPEAQPRRIQIKGSQQMIEGQSQPQS